MAVLIGGSGGSEVLMPHELQPPAIYAIADAQALAPMALHEGVARMADSGIQWIQLRAKSLPGNQICREIEGSLEALEGFQGLLWIDDRADLAALFPFGGLHLGQHDLPVAAARMVVGSEVWIGQSTHDERQLRKAVNDPEVDLVAVGPVYSTTSKERPDPVVGPPLVRRARLTTDKPLVAIGGIDAANLALVLEAGADCVAVLGAVCRGDVAANCRRLVRAAEECG